MLRTLEIVISYLVNFFQHQRIDSSTLVFDVYLIELMSIRDDEVDFSNDVLVAHLVKEIIDFAYRRLLERVI